MAMERASTKPFDGPGGLPGPTLGSLVPALLALVFVACSRVGFGTFGDAFGILASAPAIAAAWLAGSRSGSAWALLSPVLVASGLLIAGTEPTLGLGEVVGSGATLVVALMIGRLRALSQSLDEARLLADEANAAKSAFLANVSHELRTPMHGILGITELLLEDPELEQHHADEVATVRASAESLLQVINELLDLSAIERADERPLVHEPFSTVALTRSLEGLLAPVCTVGPTLVCEIGPEVPAWLLGDAQALRQVLMNLLGNAMKFTAEGEVRLLLSRRGDRLVVEVSDTGIGIAPDALDRVFEPFRQAHPDVRSVYGGTGLGLTISKRLVERLGGELRVESRVGEGTRVWFDMPLVAHESRQEHESVPLKVERREASRRVLIVDDVPLNRRLARVMVTALGWEAVEAESGEAALDLLVAASFDIVLLDLQMPGLSGEETTARLRELPPPVRDIVVVAMTASAMDGERERCLAAGMDDYLSKPYRRSELDDLLERWIGAGGRAEAG